MAVRMWSRGLAFLGILGLLLAAWSPLVGAQGTVYVAVPQVVEDDFPHMTCYVTVANEYGRPWRSIPAGEFVLQEDGSTNPVADVVVEEVPRRQPLHVVMALDTSGSMNRDNAIGYAKEAARAFVSSLNPDDQIVVLNFDEKVSPSPLPGFTSNHDDVQKTIEALQPLPAGQGETRLYDAASAAAQKASEATVGQRLVLLLTDGEDTVSSHTLDQVIREARTLAVPIFTVTIRRSRQSPSLMDDMARLSTETGGMAYVVDETNLEGLSEEFGAISELLKWQYKITYTSTVPADGGMHLLRVTVYHGASGYSERSFQSRRVEPDLRIAGAPGGLLRGQVALAVEEARGIGLDQAEFFLDGASLEQRLSLKKIDDPPFTFLWDVDKVAPGEYVLTVKAVDTSGNIGEVTMTVVIAPAVVVEIVQPAEGAEVGERFLVEVRADTVAAVDRVVYLVDGVRQVGETDQAGPYTVTVSGLAGGKHQLSAVVYDRDGHLGSDTVNFTLKSGFPPWVIILIVGLVVLAGVLVMVALFAARRREPAPVAPGPTVVAGGAPVGGFPPPPVGPAGEPPTRGRMAAVGGPGTQVSQPAVGDTYVSGLGAVGVPPARAAETEMVRAVEVAAGWLVVKEGPGAGHHFPLRAEHTTIGRSPQCEIVLSDPTASNRHAAIVHERDDFILHDLASTNGTFVWGRRVTEPHILQEGDEIRIGNTVLVFKRL